MTATRGTKVDSATLRSVLTGLEVVPVANGATSPKYKTTINDIAHFVNGNAQSFTAIIPVTIIVPFSTTAYVGTPTPTQAVVSTTSLYSFTIPASYGNTGSSTLNITFTTPLGVKTIKKLVSGVKTNLVNGDLVALSTYVVYYDGTDYVLFNGKIDALYDENGNLVLIAINGKLILPPNPTVLDRTVNRSALIRNTVGGEIIETDLDENNTLYVDGNGLNSAEIKKNALTPYLTINAVAVGTNESASNSAVSGNTININSGTYLLNANTTGTQFFKTGVYYNFNIGAVLQNAYLYDNGACTTVIRGQAFFNIISIIYSNPSSSFDAELNIWRQGENPSSSFTGTNLRLRLKTTYQNSLTPTILTLTSCILDVIIDYSYNSTVTYANFPLYSIIGCSGYLELKRITRFIDSSVPTAPLNLPVINITGTCGNLLVKLDTIQVWDNFTNAIYYTNNNIINVTNSSGTITIEAEYIYGGMTLAPTGTGRVVVNVKGRQVANVVGGDNVTINNFALISGIFQNQSTVVGSSVIAVTTDLARIKDVVAIGGFNSIKGVGATKTLITAGYANVEKTTITITPLGNAPFQDTNFANI